MIDIESKFQSQLSEQMHLLRGERWSAMAVGGPPVAEHVNLGRLSPELAQGGRNRRDIREQPIEVPS